MKLTISGSLGNTGKPLTERLVKAGHTVTVISSEASRRSAIESLGATAAIGSISDTDFLTKAFAGADAVFAMTPPNFGGSNVIKNTVKAGTSIAAAIAASKVPGVVMLSSIGADLPDGNGPIAAINQIEHLYSQLKDVAVTFLRAGYFYINFYNDIPVIRSLNVMSANYPDSIRIPLVHPADIALIAAEELQKTSRGINVRYAISDVKTPAEIAQALGAAIGKPGLPWVEITDQQFHQALEHAGLPSEIAALYTEMGAGFREGRLFSDFIKHGSPVDGIIKLEKFAAEFAERFR